jgi:hypothetical protein
MLSFNPRIAAVAGFLALGLTATATTPAAAAYESRSCDSYGCYRVRCVDDGYGERCTRVSNYYESDYNRAYAPLYDRPYYHVNSRYLCNSDGEDCRWTHFYRDSDIY